MTKQIETLLSEIESFYAAYREEDEDWGQLCKRIEKLNKLATKVRKTEAKAGEYSPLAIELGWMRALNAVSSAVGEMPEDAIGKEKLGVLLAQLAAKPQTR